VYVGLTVLLGQATIPVRGPNVFVKVLVARVGLSKTVTPPTMAVVVDPAILVVTVTTADVLVADAAVDERGASVVGAEDEGVREGGGAEDATVVTIGRVAVITACS
jgi:hypothetical protein